MATCLFKGVWTSEKPKDAGFYWIRWTSRFDIKRAPRIVSINTHHGNKRLIFLFGVKPNYVDDMEAEWCGPIERPMDKS